MEKRDTIDKVKLGVFVIGGLVIFTVFVFYIGSNNYQFGSSGRKNFATFKNVMGLRHGSIIRYSGVNIGTVDEINIIGDSAVEVTMSLDVKSYRFIKRDSKARISTEGLLGNRYISISPGSEKAEAIQDGDHIAAIEPLDFDIMLSTLNETGMNTKNITGNLDNITRKIDSGEGTLGALITDKAIFYKTEKMISSFHSAGDKTNLLVIKMAVLADSLSIASNNAIHISENLVIFTGKLNNDSSSLGKAITDTSLAKRMDRALIEVTSAAEDIKLTSGKIRGNWFIRTFGKKKRRSK
jgi:phospholipid/cholesterol/gamma-HCH transport system substrate-binding protein